MTKLEEALDVAVERIATLEAELDTERRRVDRMADTIMARDAQLHQLTQDRDLLITELQTIRKVVSHLTERLVISRTGETE